MRYKGEVVFSCHDEEGVIDVVDENENVRSLQFGTVARQSTMFRNAPNALALSYTHCVMTSLAFSRTPPRSALALGLGGGSLVKFLLAECADCQVDAVERRAAVIATAQQYFDLPPTHPRLDIHCGDAGQFLSTRVADSPGCYDLILVDLHDSSGMAPVVRRPEFFETCRNLLSEHGVLAVNLWYGYREKEEREARDSLEAAFTPRVLYLPVAGKLNCIGFAFAQPPADSDAVIGYRALEWKRRTRIDFPARLVELARFNNGLTV